MLPTVEEWDGDDEGYTSAMQWQRETGKVLSEVTWTQAGYSKDNLGYYGKWRPSWAHRVKRACEYYGIPLPFRMQ